MTDDIKQALDQVGAYIESTSMSEEMKDKFTRLLIEIERAPTQPNLQTLLNLLNSMVNKDLELIKTVTDTLKTDE